MTKKTYTKKDMQNYIDQICYSGESFHEDLLFDAGIQDLIMLKKNIQWENNRHLHGYLFVHYDSRVNMDKVHQRQIKQYYKFAKSIIENKYFLYLSRDKRDQVKNIFKQP